MANWQVDIYGTYAEFETATELLANSVTIHPFSFKEGSKTIFVLVHAT